MGLNWHGCRLLCEEVEKGLELGDVATVGRLNRNVGESKVRALISRYAPSFERSHQDIRSQYVEPLLQQLGARSVSSIDNSDYEGANYVVDLNAPLAPDLVEKFDFVLDGGTIEHVFDVKNALKNEMKMVKKGGYLFIHTMANNFFGHGFYQFSPELFYRALCKENGYCVKRLIVHEQYEFAPWYEVPDPNEVQSRIELANDRCGVLIMVLAQRVEAEEPFATPPQQSDYARRWIGSVVNAPQSVSQGGHSPIKRRVIEAVKSAAPWTVKLKHRFLLSAPHMSYLFARRRTLRDKDRGFSFENQKHKFRKVP